MAPSAVGAVQGVVAVRRGVAVLRGVTALRGFVTIATVAHGIRPRTEEGVEVGPVEAVLEGQGEDRIEKRGHRGPASLGVADGIAARIDRERTNATHETTIIAAPPNAKSREP